MYSNIVVGVDGSVSSRSALVEASHWVRKHGGDMTIVHAVYFDEEEFAHSPDQRERRLMMGKRMCLQSRETVESEFHIEAASLTCEGEPPEVIVDVARTRRADLIALGTNGKHGFKRLILGSVTSGVVTDAPCDVMVVKKPCEACTGTYRSLLVPFEGSGPARKALGRACDIAMIDGADVTILYTIPRFEEMIGFFRTEGIKERMALEAKTIVDEGVKIARAKGVEAKQVITEGHAGERIVEKARDGYDLIVMGSNGWRGMAKAIMGSTAEHVISGAALPVLVVR